MLNQAKLSLSSGDVVTAIAQLTKCIMDDPNGHEARLLRAQTLLAIGDVNSANEDIQWLINFYTRAIESNPNDADAYRNRGALRYRQGDTRGAEQDMIQALRLSPDDMTDVNGMFTARGVEQIVHRKTGMQK